MYILYFTSIYRCRICFAWYEQPRGHDYYRSLIHDAVHGGGEESKEESSPMRYIRVHCMVMWCIV